MISQTLLKKKTGGRVAAHEIMRGTSAIRHLIREDKVAQMCSRYKPVGRLACRPWINACRSW